MKKIVIRIFGGKGIGYGHYYRCLSLAKAICYIETNTQVTFIVNEDLKDLMETTEFEFIVANNTNKDFKMVSELECDLFIFDSYLGNDRDLKKIRDKTKFMLIDDNNDIYDYTIPHIIYNGNIHAINLGYRYVEEQLQLLGPKYLIMREEYWEGSQEQSTYKEGILITTGGTDEHGITLNVLKAIGQLDIKIKVVLGPMFGKEYIKEIESFKGKNTELIYKPESLKDYIASSEIVLTAGGSTVYEVLSQRSIPVVFSIADNQDLLCKELDNIGVQYLGRHPNIEYSKLVQLIKAFQVDKVHLNNKIFDIVKGNGVIEVAKAILSEI